MDAGVFIGALLRATRAMQKHSLWSKRRDRAHYKPVRLQGFSVKCMER
jgi:hypothetical protein